MAKKFSLCSHPLVVDHPAGTTPGFIGASAASFKPLHRGFSVIELSKRYCRFGLVTVGILCPATCLLGALFPDRHRSRSEPSTCWITPGSSQRLAALRRSALRSGNRRGENPVSCLVTVAQLGCSSEYQ
ncbi:hypothetical protein K491DRAFT_152901 [Lophiostoma macrostomum CBS 122681]|uniref:Uncharacterized protein n=1 Tax=Lophiostoma macrostomum CBS 122681 TaxID=1314788 RepID=A0A6A6TIX4_9PLEO|nr:hypothetical protein K491DRAFT_152901 [Lophiostoma macrostomum CBS 122681]